LHGFAAGADVTENAFRPLKGHRFRFTAKVFVASQTLSERHNPGTSKRMNHALSCMKVRSSPNQASSFTVAARAPQ
jgi:hypothetical protein